MQINVDTILSHANQKLSLAELPERRDEQVETFKRFLKIETERLRMRHRFGLGGLEIASGRSYLVDVVVSRACQRAASDSRAELSAELSRCALVALGGYGRRELAPHSDVDLLFLHGGRPSAAVREFVEGVLLLLWDVGLTVGHSFRSVTECLDIAKEDLHSRTALAETRWVAGSETLHRQLLRDLDEVVFANRRWTDSFLQSMRVELDERYAKMGRAVCVQEPNVKESAGGLRDLHTLLWVGHARYGVKGLDALRQDGHLQDGEYAVARRSYDFITRVRNEAHFASARKTDLLTLDLQPVLATGLGYKAQGGLLASERFMREYYQRAHELHRVMETFLLRAMGDTVRRGFRLRLPRARVHGPFEIRDGRLYARARSGELHGGAPRLLEAFTTAQREGAELSEPLRELIRTHVHFIDRRFRSSREASRAFMRLLERRGQVAATLRAMHETGVLGRLVPEFARITFLVQHDFYHKYTVDEHTLKAIEALDHLAESHDPGLNRFRKVFEEIEDPAPLYLGLLLHDLGKGHGGGHVARGTRIAQRICERLDLDARRTEDVIFLVDAHLLMSELSQRRDLSEPSLVESFVATVGDLKRLNLLLLLTYADHCGVGPGVWNDWKGSLLWELYSQARLHLAGGKLARWDADQLALAREKAILELLPQANTSEIERHFAMLPERYLRGTEPRDLARHFRLIQQLPGHALVAEWRTAADRHCTELTVCTKDRPGLFAQLAGTLSTHGINILSVDLYTRQDGVVIDTFRLSEIGEYRPVRPERWERVDQDLRAAVEGRLDVADAVARWRTRLPRRTKRRTNARWTPSVRFDSTSSPTSTVIEVRAEDEPGLAYTIASTLAGLGLDITFAKIATEKNHALDVFYVTDDAGEPLTPTRMPAVEVPLLEALGEPTKEVNS